jgi:hypothetical protein
MGLGKPPITEHPFDDRAEGKGISVGVYYASSHTKKIRRKGAAHPTPTESRFGPGLPTRVGCRSN